MIQAPDMFPVPEAAAFPAGALAHPEPFVVRFRIGPEQIGRVIEHASNVAYVGWLDRAAELHADAVGFTRARLVEEGIMWFVARHEVDYLAEVHADDELLLATWVRDIRRVKSWRDAVVYRPADDRLVCRAATLWVLVGLDDRRPRRFTGEMADRFRPTDAPAAPSRRAAPA